MPLRFPRLAALVIVLVLGLVVGTASAWARAADETQPTDPATPTANPPSTDAIVAAARRYLAAASKRADLAGERANRELSRCEEEIDSAPAQAWKPLDNLIANHLASKTWIAVEPAYGRLAADLAAAAGDDVVLGQAAAAASVLHDLQAPLLTKRIGICSLVLRWQKAGWSKRFTASYAPEFAQNPLSRTDQKRVDEAKQAASPASTRLVELGVSQADAVLFETAFGFVLV